MEHLFLSVQYLIRATLPLMIDNLEGRESPSESEESASFLFVSGLFLFETVHIQSSKGKKGPSSSVPHCKIL